MNTKTYLTPAPVIFAVPRPQLSLWTVPVQGTGVSAAGSQHARVTGMTNATSTTPATAAKNRKNAAGGEAFEDPV